MKVNQQTVIRIELEEGDTSERLYDKLGEYDYDSPVSGWVQIGPRR